MGKRRRKQSPLFAAVSAILLFGGILLATKLAKKPLDLLFAVAVVIVAAPLIASLIVTLLRRPSQTPRYEPGSFSASTAQRGEPRLGEQEVDIYALWKEGRTGVREVDTTRWSLDLLRALEWHRFELLCRGYFEALGFRSETTRFGADGGVDIHLYAADATTPSILVQCKAWNAYKVGIKLVRELVGVMTLAKVGEGILVTTGSFTSEAFGEAARAKVHLIDGPDLLKKIAVLGEEKSRRLLELATNGDFSTPTCPSCGVKMTTRTRGKDGSSFWGCINFPRCRRTF